MVLRSCSMDGMLVSLLSSQYAVTEPYLDLVKLIATHKKVSSVASRKRRSFEKQ